VLLFGFCDEPLSIVMELMSGGSLYNYLRTHGRSSITMETRTKILHGIARGLLHLHSENIIHRDLATRNVLLSNERSLIPKISDFVSEWKIEEEKEKEEMEYLFLKRVYVFFLSGNESSEYG
jgi:serine/threonine protein kinase